MVSAGLGVFAIDVLLLRHYDAMTNFIHDKTRSIALSLSLSSCYASYACKREDIHFSGEMIKTTHSHYRAVCVNVMKA